MDEGVGVLARTPEMPRQLQAIQGVSPTLGRGGASFKKVSGKVLRDTGLEQNKARHSGGSVGLYFFYFLAWI